MHYYGQTQKFPVVFISLYEQFKERNNGCRILLNTIFRWSHVLSICVNPSPVLTQTADLTPRSHFLLRDYRKYQAQFILHFSNISSFVKEVVKSAEETCISWSTVQFLSTILQKQISDSVIKSLLTKGRTYIRKDICSVHGEVFVSDKTLYPFLFLAILTHE